MFWYINNISLETIQSNIQSLNKAESCIIANGGDNPLIKSTYKLFMFFSSRTERFKVQVLYLKPLQTSKGHKGFIDLKAFICSDNSFLWKKTVDT